MKRFNKIFVVVNGAAGGGRALLHWPRVCREIRRQLGPFDFEETARSGHARLLAAAAARSGYRLVVSYGGDGTIHETVNGLKTVASSKTPVLGILSAGTGGDFIKSLRIPPDINDQIAVLSRRESVRIDLGRVEYTNSRGKKERRFFVNVAEAGLGGEVVRRLPAHRRMFGRRLAYLFSTLRSYASFLPKRMSFRTDDDGGHWPDRCLLAAVANGRYFGGGMPIAPEADLRDGLLDLVAVGDMGPLMALAAVPLLYLGKIDRLPLVRSAKIKSLILSSKEKVSLEIDGEPIGMLPARFEAVPSALEVKAPLPR